MDLAQCRITHRNDSEVPSKNTRRESFCSDYYDWKGRYLAKHKLFDLAASSSPHPQSQEFVSLFQI